MKLIDGPKKLCVFFIRLYQNFISPQLRKKGIKCRFHPTCSNYGILAIQKYGVLKGVMKTWNRLYRCRPGNLESCIDYP